MFGRSAFVFLLCVPAAHAQDDFFKPKTPDAKPPAGKADLLREVPKKYATLESVDTANHRVTLQVEGEKQTKTWPVNSDAELKIHGWWGRLEQFRAGDRVWVWFDINRKKEPKSVLMLADEISQQDINGAPVAIVKLDETAATLTVRNHKGATRALVWPDEFAHSNWREGSTAYLQSSQGATRILRDAGGLEDLRSKQKIWLRERWTSEGLPGAVVFLHPLGGEMDVMLDHEAIRWGRWLKNGDKVTLATNPPIDGVVREVHPYRERTQVRLVVSGIDQSDLTLGQRIHLKMPVPPPEVDASELPPDLDRPRSKEDRVEWFLASIYCSCNIKGDRCTGMFYTLASCNTHGCGMPNQMRIAIGKLIDQGMTDKQVFEELKKIQGPLLSKPHLLP